MVPPRAPSFRPRHGRGLGLPAGKAGLRPHTHADPRRPNQGRVTLRHVGDAGGRELGDLLVRVAGLAQDLGRVLAHGGRRARMEGALAVEGQRERGQGQVVDPRVLEPLEDPERRRLWRLGDVADVRDRSGGHAGGPEALEPGRRWLGAETLLDQRDEGVAVADAVGVRPEPRVVDDLGQADDVADRAEEPVVAACHQQLAVLRRHHLVGRHHREPRPLAGRDRPVGEVAGEVVADVADCRLVQRHVDDAACAGALALEKRREHAERRPGAGALVDERGADADSRPPGLAGDRDQAAGRLHQRVVPRFAGERAGVAVRAERAVDEPRVAVAEDVRAEPELLGEAGAQALEEHVGAVGEAQERVAPARVTEGQPERALARVRREEHRPLAVPERRAPGARVVARVRPLDLDDVGAQRSQDLRAVRARDRRRHVEHARPLERPVHGAHHRVPRLCDDGSRRVRRVQGLGLGGVVELRRSSSPCRRSTRSSRSSRARASSSPRGTSPRAATSGCSG